MTSTAEIEEFYKRKILETAQAVFGPDNNKRHLKVYTSLIREERKNLVYNATHAELRMKATYTHSTYQAFVMEENTGEDKGLILCESVSSGSTGSVLDALKSLSETLELKLGGMVSKAGQMTGRLFYFGKGVSDEET